MARELRAVRKGERTGFSDHALLVHRGEVAPNGDATSFLIVVPLIDSMYRTFDTFDLDDFGPALTRYEELRRGRGSRATSTASTRRPVDPVVVEERDDLSAEVRAVSRLMANRVEGCARRCRVDAISSRFDER